MNAFASANGYDELIDAIVGGKGQIQVVLDRKGKGRRMMVDDEAEGGEGDLAELEEQAQAARPAMTIEDETAAQARRDMDYIRERRRELTARAEAEAEKKQAAMRQLPFLGGGIPIGSYPPSSALPLSSMPVPR